MSTENPMPFSPWPHYDADEIQAVADVLRAGDVNYWTGNRCRQFEKNFGEFAGTNYAVAVTNGTVALDLALNALGIGEGDEVIVTPRTFIASISTVVNAGAIPVFADVDRDSGNITPQTIEAALTARTRAVIPVHLAGWPCDMAGIMALGRRADFAVIEDCAQAHGAKIGDQSVGSFGDIGAWSFCQDKIMSTGGEGGMVTTGREDLWSSMWSFKDHGKNWDSVYGEQEHPGYKWVHDSFGTNWRMLEMQAAIGLLQLKKLPSWHQRRAEIARRIRQALKEFPDALRCPEPESSVTHAYYRQYAYVRPEGLRDGWSRDRIVAEAGERGLPLFQGSCSEVYLEKAFDGTGWRPAERLPAARELGETSLAFLTHPTITDDQIEFYIAGLTDVLQQASR